MKVILDIDVGFFTGGERELKPGAKPVIGSILLQNPLENYGIQDYNLKLNGQPANLETEIHDGDRITIIAK